MHPFQHSMEVLIARARKDVTEVVRRLTKKDFVDSYLIEHKNGQSLWWDVYRVKLLGTPCFLSLRENQAKQTIVGPVKATLEEVLAELRSADEPHEVAP